MANMFRLRKEGRRGGWTEWVGRQGGGALEAQVFKLHGLEERTEQKFHVGEGGLGGQPAYRDVKILNDQMGTECSHTGTAGISGLPFHLFIRPRNPINE